jgi:hypothetical protein
VTSQEPASTAGNVAALLSALEKMPAYDGISFRGRPASAAFRHPGQVVVSKGLVATSQDVRVATENISCDGIYAVVGGSGRSISSQSRHPEEKEIVFLPSTMFLVVEDWQAHEVNVTLIEQLDPQRDIAQPSHRVEDVRTVIDKHVAMALQRSDIAVASPGKFIGGFD